MANGVTVAPRPAFLRRSIACAAFACAYLASGAGASSAPPAAATFRLPAARYATKWGFEVHPNSWSAASLAAVARTGATFVRMDLAENWVAQPNGTYDWSIYDTFVSKARTAGLGVMFVGPYLYRGFDRPGSYTGFLTAAAKRYAGRHVMYELGPNEPNNPHNGIGLSAAQYAAYAIPAADAIKRADPTALTISSGTSSFDYPWQQTLATLGVGRHVDAIGVHAYYEYPATLQSDLAKLSAIYGGTRPIYITEFGVPAQYASFLIQMLEAAKSYVPVFNVYEFEDQNATDTYGMLTFAGAARPELAQVEGIIK